MILTSGVAIVVRSCTSTQREQLKEMRLRYGRVHIEAVHMFRGVWSSVLQDEIGVAEMNAQRYDFLSKFGLDVDVAMLYQVTDKYQK